MTTPQEIESFLAENEPRYNELKNALKELGKDELLFIFFLFQLHLNELRSIYDKNLKPEIEELIKQESQKFSNLPKFSYYIPFDYKLDIQLHSLTKAYFFSSRICIDDLLKILHAFHSKLEVKPNGYIIPKEISKFVPYFLNGSHRNLDPSIVKLLDMFFIDFLILRFMRNILKSEGMLIFDLRYYDEKYHLHAKFKFRNKGEDRAIELLKNEGLLTLENDELFFDVEILCERIFQGLSALKEAVIDVIIKNASFHNVQKSPTVSQLKTTTIDANRNLGSSTAEGKDIVPPVDLDLEEGSFVVWSPPIEKREVGEIVFSYLLNNGHFIVSFEGENELTVSYRYNKRYSIISTDFSKYQMKYTHICITWGLTSNTLILYLDGEKIVEEKIYE